ncbi:MAG: tRNA (adenosine(37)-N6)-dimethylallyltransferase MiaA [Candidatus Tagabacteria bacterium RIFCSPLOWO2_01_FULL_42_9]|uniref:tRNA dimethylallyltransferase n=1 Tax=Candidatus Tagabacteria bacterium RIFCSPLOWO2_01_FULL_42_9 TaxID=1802296 RepID=A0A1G2LVI8_9BACT|nr:MAG: tRNA (adenosine(37)-N6)-dimethylallyltransferase MiaA [Candidatus Tagabacteria bacterium RIFCSPLOWO2_01_FULL_42_9]
MQKPKLIVVIGQTASGKSALAIGIAKKFNGEIVSADSKQIYREMNIGTAKPPIHIPQGIPHHLIDIKNPDEDYSAGEYKEDAIKAINKITGAGKLPILVGGTGLYISAIVNNLKIPKIKENKKLRMKLQKEINENGLDFVFKKLLALDPEAACIVDSKNPRRVIRALEIAIVSGKKFSKQRRIGKPLYNVLEIGLNPPAKLLHKKISERIKQMFEAGLIDEVKKLVKKYGHNCKAFNAIGYGEVIDYLRARMSLKEAMEQMNKNTRRYAKRQMTWFIKYNPKAHWTKQKNEAFHLVKRFLKN